jgi:hypothetical protein
MSISEFRRRSRRRGFPGFREGCRVRCAQEPKRSTFFPVSGQSHPLSISSERRMDRTSLCRGPCAWERPGTPWNASGRASRAGIRRIRRQGLGGPSAPTTSGSPRPPPPTGCRSRPGTYGSSHGSLGSSWRIGAGKAGGAPRHRSRGSPRPRAGGLAEPSEGSTSPPRRGRLTPSSASLPRSPAR